jgi:hypothetical protein
MFLGFERFGIFIPGIVLPECDPPGEHPFISPHLINLKTALY